MRPRDKLLCEKCKIDVSAYRLEAHKEIWWHVYREDLLRMTNSGSTLEAMGQRFGVTRERLRQVLKLLGLDNGQPRRREILAAKMKAAGEDQLNDFWSDETINVVYQRCSEHGLEILPIPRSFNRGFRKTLCWVNGFNCAIRVLIPMKKGNGRYLRLSNGGTAEYFLAKNPNDGSWWVIPNQGTREGTAWKGTIFAETYCTRRNWVHWHDYSVYKEAWHLLKGGQNAEVQSVAGGDGKGSGPGESISG